MVDESKVAATPVEVVNLPVLIIPLFIRRKGTTNTTTAVLLLADQVKPTDWWVMDFAAIYNQSGESVTAQWVIVRGSETIVVSEDLTVADGKAVRSNILPTIQEGEAFGVQVTGTAKKGTITLVVSAHIID
jgi:hypothetical protein